MRLRLRKIVARGIEQRVVLGLFITQHLFRLCYIDSFFLTSGVVSDLCLFHQTNTCNYQGKQQDNPLLPAMQPCTPDASRLLCRKYEGSVGRKQLHFLHA